MRTAFCKFKIIKKHCINENGFELFFKGGQKRCFIINYVLPLASYLKNILIDRRCRSSCVKIAERFSLRFIRKFIIFRKQCYLLYSSTNFLDKTEIRKFPKVVEFKSERRKITPVYLMRSLRHEGCRTNTELEKVCMN